MCVGRIHPLFRLESLQGTRGRGAGPTPGHSPSPRAAIDLGEARGGRPRVAQTPGPAAHSLLIVHMALRDLCQNEFQIPGGKVPGNASLWGQRGLWSMTSPPSAREAARGGLTCGLRDAQNLSARRETRADPSLPQGRCFISVS